MSRICIAQSDDDPDVITTWGLFELDEAAYEALRDDADWIASESRRMERMAEFEEEVIASGFFRVLRRDHPARQARHMRRLIWQRHDRSGDDVDRGRHVPHGV